MFFRYRYTHVSIIKINPLVLYKETVAFYTVNHPKYINILNN